MLKKIKEEFELEIEYDFRSFLHIENEIVGSFCFSYKYNLEK